ncbi:unnamed protein product [Prunus armeniaca]|nr:hypothetical protein GBA52_010688 [Prunus armeniaca]
MDSPALQVYSLSKGWRSQSALLIFSGFGFYMLWGCGDRKEKGGCEKEKTIERKEEMGRATGDQCWWQEEGGRGGLLMGEF